MKKLAIIGVAMVVLLFGNCTHAGVSVIKNSGFENDGYPLPTTNIFSYPLQYWWEVNSLNGKFVGKLDPDWSTYIDGGCSMVIYSKAAQKYDAGDMGTVSQKVYLQDVNEIIFDLKLKASSGGWNPARRSAVVLIDGSTVWDSKDWPPGANSEYHNQEIDISGIGGMGDGKLHTLSLGIKSIVTELVPSYVQFETHWDFVKFDAHCGGFGYLPEDLNHDCYVDMKDLGLLAGQWLTGDPNYRYDLFEDDQGIVNFHDYLVFAASWLDDSDWKNWPANNCYVSELLEADLNDDGIVNLQDFAILAGDWLGYSDAANIKGDINRSKRVDYDDISIMAEEWLMRSWLYGLN